ncbi:conserved hypothetical protein [Frankia sp. Hr75.2]|nr:conserved hypothetical protein [Frankia sp. Hr75.2]
MSLGHQLAAWDLLPGELSPQERVTLVALAEDCRSGRDVASPGHKILTARTGLGRSQLSATIARLAARGLVALAERARRGRNAVYRLLFAEAERPDSRTQTDPNGTDHGSDSVRQIGTLPGSCSSPENNPSRKRSGRIASKIRRRQPWQEPANLPDTPVRTFIPPRQGTGATAPDWAVDEARRQMAGKVCSPLMLAALARSIAGAAA